LAEIERTSVLPYRSPSGNAADGRRWFSPRAAVAVGAVLLTLWLTLRVLVPAANEFASDFGAVRTPAGGRLMHATNYAHEWRWWVAAGAVTVVVAVTAGVARRRIEDQTINRAARWRTAFVTLAACGGIVLVAVTIMGRPLLTLRRDLTTPVAEKDGVRTFANASAVYRYVAGQEYGLKVTPDEVLRVAAGATVDYHEWPGGRLWVIAPTNFYDPQVPLSTSYFRGAQGTGSYYLIAQRPDGLFDLVGDAGGNVYTLKGEGAGATLQTSWHMGAAERVVTVYRFDGRRFAEVSRETQTGDDAPEKEGTP
jgi:hypothetical protein